MNSKPFSFCYIAPVGVMLKVGGSLLLTFGSPLFGQATLPVKKSTAAVRAIPVEEERYATARLPMTATSDPNRHPIYFSLPAPRGQIVDRLGRALAQTRVGYRLIRTAIKAESEEAYLKQFHQDWPAIQASYPFAIHPGDEALRGHWKDRSMLPLVLSSVREFQDVPAGEEGKTPAWLKWQAAYVRYYPQKDLASHTLGYVTETGSPLKGALLHEEPLWMEVEGRTGLEKSYDERLRGQPGLLLRQVDARDYSYEDVVIASPKPGSDIITTLDLEVQRAVEGALSKAQKPGAAVVISVDTGDILAMASWPTFDGNAFAAGISAAEFEALMSAEQKPLFNRAISAEYPPGSVFKPIVALAGLRSGGIIDWQCLPCGPTLEIEGRTFKNWSDSDKGMLPLRGALIRSCNTYFYQAGIHTGAPAIIGAAQEFGFGFAPALPLPGVAAGRVPQKAPGLQAVANLSIGQGELLTTPMQVAIAMGSLVNEKVLLRPRLVMQSQNQKGQVTAVATPCREAMLRFTPDALENVRHAMYGVVNHTQGTAGRARLAHVSVAGKTGTAQWTNQGKEASVVWFAGFIDQSSPRLAFVVALEAEDSGAASGGRLAAPVVGQFLTQIFPQKKAASKEVDVVYQGAKPVMESDPLFYSDSLSTDYSGYESGYDNRYLPSRSQPYSYNEPTFFRRIGRAFGLRR